LSRAAVELPLSADRGRDGSLAGQIAGQLRSGIGYGRLGAGERLPASRVLAASLGVSRTVVTAAYGQLYAEGWLEGRHGSGTYVAAGAPGQGSLRRPHSLIVEGCGGSSTHNSPRSRKSGSASPDSARPAGPAAQVIELRPGIPWAAGIDRAAWRRAWRQAGAVPPSAWPDPLGLPALRQALATHLRRSRALPCEPDQILVTRGVTSGLGLLAAALLRPGDRVGIEEPGYPAARAVFAVHGAQLVPCRADEHGLVTAELPGNLRMIYTTPAHQYPLGGRLPVPRRQSLVAWARATGALIVEDDYDSEFRYDVAPLPALFGLDPGVVVHLGTTAKTLTPAMGVGWLVSGADLAGNSLAGTGGGLAGTSPFAGDAPAGSLVGLIAGAKLDIGDRTSEAAQHALLALLHAGDLDRHIRRMRREYARRRTAIVAALGGLPAPVRLLGDTAGLHVVLELPAGTADQVAAVAGRRGVAVSTMARYFAGQPSAEGLVLGYGGASLSQVSRACQVLRQIVSTLPATVPPAKAPPSKRRPRPEPS
jgi:GntR family transcriptional regulator / MocR family aminotransferase